jgi:hypothetical protein
MERQDFTCDVELAIFLQVSSATISNVRHRKLLLSQKLLNRIQEIYGISMREIRDLIDDRRQVIRMTDLAESKTIL